MPGSRRRSGSLLPCLASTSGTAARRHSTRPRPTMCRLSAFADFSTAEGYYGTLAHEATHWTGYPSRLTRDLTGRFGSAAYAAEELVAELGAAFALAALGLVTEPRPDHSR